MAAGSTYKVDDDSLQNLDLYIMNTVTMLSLEADRQASTYKTGLQNFTPQATLVLVEPGVPVASVHQKHTILHENT